MVRLDSASSTSRIAVSMVFSYWTTAMFCRTACRFRLAWRWPPSKIGSEIVGANCQARLPLLNRPSSSALAVPQLPVRAMRGKNAARAADTLALAACRPYSAAMMSGRCVSRSDGRPSGMGFRITAVELLCGKRSASIPVSCCSALACSARCCAS
ncbi:hypothetical protein SDC9_180541 [bioreactor metagenome]|uniref:Uncharacterized protein n=1 Tax=bioreactor metagenome TaxID=1076179 RepID=A0A645H225_9ZZZZ